MIACPSCNTMNSDSERICLTCDAPLPTARREDRVRQNAGSARQTEVWRCPNGHPVDPRWSSCPYCTSSGKEARSTRLEERAVQVRAAAGRATRLEQPPPPRGVPSPAPRSTMLRPAQAGRPVSDGVRPLVAVLAAPGAAPGGLIFPLRVGQNLIGSDPGCDVRLEGDPQVSRQHAQILHREGKFLLNDRLSTNGTILNGSELDPAQPACVVRDRDRIRCGGTELILLALEQEGESG